METRVIKCIGYKGHKCGKTVRCVRSNRKRCSDCLSKDAQVRLKAWHKANPKKRRAYHISWRKANLAYARAYDRARNTARSEHKTVMDHHRLIFNPKNSRYANYRGMPFFDGWNPDKGGTYKAGTEWIIVNLGKRPKGCSLHIINHEKGFVPDNLEWTGRKKQNNQQMFKIIAQLKHEIKDQQALISLLLIYIARPTSPAQRDMSL